MIMSHSKCYECSFKRNVPGDCHISCVNPVLRANQNDFKIMMSIMLGNNNVLKETVGISFDPYGTQQGWCSFPHNYDPTWVNGDCKLYEKIPVKQES